MPFKINILHYSPDLLGSIIENINGLTAKNVVRKIIQCFDTKGFNVKIQHIRPNEPNAYYRVICFLNKSKEAVSINTKKDQGRIGAVEGLDLKIRIENKNTFFIPSFAIHRSTELAYMLKVIWDRNEKIRNADIPIYMCGVMMGKAHRIIGNPKYKTFYDEQWQDLDDLFTWDKLRFIENFKDLQGKVVSPQPKIIVASSGMMTGGYSKYLLSCYVGQKNCSILFTGYQAINSEGRKLLEQEHKTISIDGKQYMIRAKIVGKLEGLSGHSDHNGLTGIFKTINLHNLKKVIIIHGEESRKEVLKESLETQLPDKVEVIVPNSKSVIKI
jgi:metallo-beta-lactamase family protein